jgi:hypothetical protein
VSYSSCIALSESWEVRVAEGKEGPTVPETSADHTCQSEHQICPSPKVTG